jgi:hypothetical protein
MIFNALKPDGNLRILCRLYSSNFSLGIFFFISYNSLNRTGFLNIQGEQESIPRNQIHQHLQPGGPVREHYSYSIPSPHRLLNSSSGN